MKLSSSYIPFVLLFISVQFTSFYNLPPRKFSPPHEHTGAPGEGLCSDFCHIQNDPNAMDPVTNGSFNVFGLPSVIEPNTTYSISIRLENLSQHGKVAGFQLVALEGNEENSISTGSFSNFGNRVEASSPSFGDNTNRIYLRHDDNALLFGDQGSPLNRITYTADWTSPANITSPIYFYAAGIIGNDDNSNQGDLIRTYTYSYTPPLPVVLSHFDAQQINKQEVEITWTTETESSSDYFEVLRSSNGKDYEVLEKVAAAGSSTQAIQYAFIDKDPLINQTAFYRLKQIDLNGKFVYSATKSLEMLDFDNNEMSILPNPVQEGNCIFVDFLATKDYPNATLQVLDITGRVIADLKTMMPNGLLEGFNKIIVDTRHLPEGLYFLNVHDSGKILANQTVVIIN